MNVGRNALGTTCCWRTSRSGTPFARAVCTKSSLIVSIIEERITIEYPPM